MITTMSHSGNGKLWRQRKDEWLLEGEMNRWNTKDFHGSGNTL